MNGKMSIRVMSIILLLILVAGCAPRQIPPSPEMIQTAIAETQAAVPTETPLPPTPAATNTPAPSPTPYQTPAPTTSPPIAGKISAAFLNLRTGPSTFFEIIHTFVEDTPIIALSRTPDSEWVKVEIDFEDDPTMEGWMAVIYLELDGNVPALPVEEVGLENAITGKVTDTEDNPIPGINIAFIVNNDQFDLSGDILSNQEGVFTIYLPDDLITTFDIQVISWDCESPIADANCQMSGYIQVEDRAFIDTPQTEEINFTYEKTSMVLTGVVEDKRGDPADRVLVIAERDDGATSLGRSDALGEFSIPISAGTWKVYAVTYTPDYTEGDQVNVEVADSAPEPISIIAPDS